MNNTLTIPDQAYQDAANAVWQVRRNPQPAVSLDLIGKEIRSYVYAGQNKLIQQDYDFSLSDTLKNVLYNTVQSALNDQYGLSASPIDISLTLQALQTQAALGLVSQQILKPMQAEIDWEATITAAHATDPTTWDYFLQGVRKFFGGAFETIAAALGISVNTLYLIGAAVLAFVILK